MPYLCEFEIMLLTKLIVSDLPVKAHVKMIKTKPSIQMQGIYFRGLRKASHLDCERFLTFNSLFSHSRIMFYESLLMHSSN